MSPDEVTERLNEVCDQIDDQGDGDRAFLAAAARRLLANVEWDSSPDEKLLDEHTSAKTGSFGRRDQAPRQLTARRC